MGKRECDVEYCMQKINADNDKSSRMFFFSKTSTTYHGDSVLEICVLATHHFVSRFFFFFGLFLWPTALEFLPLARLGTSVVGLHFAERALGALARFFGAILGVG